MTTVKCTRCTVPIEFTNELNPKITCFLCNSCDLRWKEIENRLLGHTYSDEMRKAFIKFINDLTTLQNNTLRGFKNGK